MTVLVRFSCGCIGSPPVDGQSLVIGTCDDAKPGVRDVKGKTFEPCSEEEQARVVAWVRK